MRPEPATTLFRLTRLTRLAHAPRAWLWLVLVGLLCVQSAALAAHELDHAHTADPDCVVCHVVAQPPLLEARAPIPMRVSQYASLSLLTAEAVPAPRFLLSPPLRAPPAAALV